AGEPAHGEAAHRPPVFRSHPRRLPRREGAPRQPDGGGSHEHRGCRRQSGEGRRGELIVGGGRPLSSIRAYAATLPASPLMISPSLPAETLTSSPSRISPARISSASRSWRCFWMTRLSGRAP